MTRHLTVSLFALVAALLIVAGAVAQTRDATNDMSWLDGYSLIVLESEDVAGLHHARTVIQSHGGRVAIMSPPSFILGWIPYGIRAELIGKAGIKDIFYTEMTPDEVGAHGRQPRAVLRFYNSVVRGDIQRKYFEDAARSAPASEWPRSGSDALQPPPLDESAYLENLKGVGLDIERLKDQGMLLQKSESVAGNSDRMTGTISLTLFFVESDGSGSDPDVYTWTDEHVQDYINGASAGLTWWTTQAYTYFDCWNAFLVHFFPPTDPRCQQEYEPIIHSSSFTSTWISIVMSNFGYNGGGAISKVNAFNTFQRTTYGTDWAYSAFIPYNPPGAADSFTNGVSAFAYLGGPYTVLPFRSYSWPPEQVFAHESGHIFYACDEYEGSNCSCTNCAGKLNQNCHLCSSGFCMMKANNFQLCAWTPAQVGWLGLGCAPPPLPAPTISGVAPGGALQGVRTTITITGNNFLFDPDIDLGPYVTINAIDFVNAQTLDVDITINSTSPLGLVDLALTNRDLQGTILADALEILPTPRHYVSSTGNDVFPYITAADAANSLADAIDAAANGDSIYVESGAFGVTDSLKVFRGMHLSGAWNGSFTGRDLVSGKTVLDLAASGGRSVLVNAPGDTVSIDGFVIQNGSGSLRPLPEVPIAGDYGGAIYINETTITVSNCDIHSNTATTGGNFGAGGAIYAVASVVDFRDLTITGNTSGQGGAIFLDGCTGSVSSSTISGNELVPTTQPMTGGGVHLTKCTSVSLVNNVIDDNIGSNVPYRGGGVYVDTSIAVTITGGVISHSEVTDAGGGVYYELSSLTLDGVRLLRNTARFGGGLGSDLVGTGVVVMTGCELSWNDAVFGGGALLTGSTTVHHNLFIGNSGSSSPGGCWIVTPTGGSFIGNTLDRNASLGTGGVELSGAAIPVFNNIVVNSGGYGIKCSGVLPSLDHNNVWNSSASDYVGCSPGPGATSGDPVFADTASVDYHLGLHSPCIDAGDPNPVYNDPDDSRGDMGWYGSHTLTMDQPSYPTNLTAAISSNEITLKWSSNPEPDVAWYVVYKDTTEDFAPSPSNFVMMVAAPDTMADAGTFAEGCYYKVSAVDTSGYAGGYSDAAVGTATGTGDPVAVYRLQLFQNHPNPFNPVTRIRYEIDRRVSVRLSVYDVGGRLVTTLANEVQSPGVYSVEWDAVNDDGRPVTSGIYFCRLDAGGVVQTRKMVLLK